jgi:hypothetical protein
MEPNFSELTRSGRDSPTYYSKIFFNVLCCKNASYQQYFRLICYFLTSYFHRRMLLKLREAHTLLLVLESTVIPKSRKR